MDGMGNAVNIGNGSPYIRAFSVSCRGCSNIQPSTPSTCTGAFMPAAGG